MIAKRQTNKISGRLKLRISFIKMSLFSLHWDSMVRMRRIMNHNQFLLVNLSKIRLIYTKVQNNWD